jgi:hypothetical protein
MLIYLISKKKSTKIEHINNNLIHYKIIIKYCYIISFISITIKI